jgi:hypothetical protein
MPVALRREEESTVASETLRTVPEDVPTTGLRRLRKSLKAARIKVSNGRAMPAIIYVARIRS